MSSIPQGAFMTCKLRQRDYHESEFMLARKRAANKEKNELKNFIDNDQQLDYTPVKYNEKLMNSIWGLYNRYSPHNTKKNEYVPKEC